jgi:PadR family transcriptional regulator, regulatory protein PadR
MVADQRPEHQRCGFASGQAVSVARPIRVCDASAGDVSSGGVTEQALLVLASLATGEMHGYGIAGDVESLSNGRVRLGAGTLYGVLNRLVADGLIEHTREETVGGRRRRYYQLTSSGRELLAVEAGQLSSTAAAVDARVAAAARLRPRPA